MVESSSNYTGLTSKIWNRWQFNKNTSIYSKDNCSTDKYKKDLEYVPSIIQIDSVGNGV